MLKFFRKIRQKLLSENRFSKYAIYALGEIFLVVIGILIALQINNWNEAKKIKQTEKEILEGIRENLIKDTFDINLTIRHYQNEIKNDSLLLEHLIYGKPYEPFVVEMLAMCMSEYSLVLHTSYFKEAEQRGLSIISNKELRDEISNLYEFKYVYLLKAENEMPYYRRYFTNMRNSIENYLETDSTSYQKNELYKTYQLEFGEDEKWAGILASAYSISPESYKKLLADKKFHRALIDAREDKKSILLEFYFPASQQAEKVRTAIKEELKNFD